MRQTISGLVAAIAVVAASAAPASACGLFESTCGQSYVVAPVYSGCNTGCGGGWAYERLPDPVQQYYYANQGPTYEGPGNFAPYPTYQESAVSDWGAYQHHPYYYGYHSHPHFRPWHAHTGYHGWGHQGMRYGYEGHHGYAPHYSLPPRGYYAPHHNMRYGYHGMPHHYGYREHTLRRYY
jgi:hypothetical protein